ncbi:glycoside hydrolase family 130 protein [Parvularcula dongshanensis]|uniref:4-O-beta-D-mannosyl-D-glucose phosphorylase n=1 Tax=Parvularcula dongshanensis TaxID=1173995 RepID=A0A840I7W4_9PROT|nr:glycosidase [Parvularcula dongshanensis]MBB4660371.1 4-O-beta-D-mannosyl-D-glucose phosphorylase [Parvularcula dongshanensis]
MTDNFDARLVALREAHTELVDRPNPPIKPDNGIYARYAHPVISAAHAPLHWRYDLDERSNPYLMERLGVNAAFNAGAIKWEHKYVLCVRTEGWDRKSFFALAESDDGVSGFRFRDLPIELPEAAEPATNVYDMRLTRHEDGYVYGTFCAERHDDAKPHDPSAATAAAGIVRTRDLERWERLPDLKTNSSQQRNVVLHPEFVDGRYMLYTRPQDGFIDAGSGGGIAYGFTNTMEGAVVSEEKILDPRVYHTVKEVKNGQGPAPIKTREGWLHLAHGVRNTAAGLRYTCYLFVTERDRPWIIKYAPGGHLLAPEGDERVGDVSNVVFSNGWIADEDDRVFIYYGSSDTRTHVATTTIERLLDYAKNTPADGYTSGASVRQRTDLARRNLELMKAKGWR